MLACVFFFNAPATPEIYTLSLHDALPISFSTSTRNVIPFSGGLPVVPGVGGRGFAGINGISGSPLGGDRKSTRLNSSHGSISYAVFCLKKKKKSTLERTGQ